MSCVDCNCNCNQYSVCQCSFPCCTHSSFPFQDLNNDELCAIFGSNTTDTHTDINNLNFLSGNEDEFHFSRFLNCKYYIDEDFTTEFSNIDHHFSILHFNSRSLNKNFNAISNFISTLCIDFSVYGFSETWINDSTPLLFNVSGYSFIHSDRQEGKGGGVGLLVADNFEYVIRNDILYPSCDYESLFIEINLPRHKNIIVGVIYRKPQSNINDFIPVFENCLQKTNTEHKQVYIMGDFNIDLMKYTGNAVCNFLSAIHSNFFIPLIDKPSRMTDRSISLIDNIFTNNFDLNVSSGLFYNDISDHFPIFQITQKQFPIYNISVYNTRIINDVSLNVFKEDLLRNDWNIFNYTDVVVAFEKFSTTLSLLYNRAFVKKTFKSVRKKIRKPWITFDLYKKIRNKNKVYRRYCHSPTENNKRKYVQLRNYTNKLLKLARKDYYKMKFYAIKGNMKKTWQLINGILGKSHNALPNFINVNGKQISNSKDIANHFNNFFVNIGPSLKNSLSLGNTDKFAKFLPKQNSNSVYFKAVSENEIIDVVKKLNCTNSCGIDEFNPDVIKNVIHYIVTPLCYIFNLSISTGVVPSRLKIAKVVPVHKKSDIHNVDNYRPISILPYFSKILERLVYNRTYSYLCTNSILNDSQYGFFKACVDRNGCY